jgi:FdhD protein
MMGSFMEAQDLYRRTRGVHSSALSDGERLIFKAEDIGRHNTLDKLAGLLLESDQAAAPRYILTTGRISSEMLQKSARMQAPLVVSRTAPNSMSIRMAEELGITLIGYARRDEFTVYAHAERLG